MVDVAIVGIGCRFAGGVNSPSELWQFLLNKGDGMVEVPAERWNLDRFYDPDPDVPGKMYVRRGGFLTDSLEAFDPEFFGISPREASIMDPQQRLLLEVAQEALDDAGHAGRVAGRPVGVYVGGFTADNMAARHAQSTRHAISMHTPTSSTYTMLSNRLSFAFDLRGPSMTIDTACSSSLVALHEAVSALQRAEIEMALVGGVNAMIRPETFISMCKGHFLAPDGRCKTFDKRADGYARGEGAGIVVLRPLAQAQADGDRIYAVIKATGANQDGRTPGITVPNPEAQAALIQEVTQRSGLDPAQIGYVEAHGTGTAVGDPLEMAAIGKELGAVAGRHSPLRVGSIKPSIGHTEAAAGVASVIKTALTLYHRTIVPQGWLDELNPAIPFSEYQVVVPLQVEPFPPQYELPAAAINGFGYGGTNAHAILVAPPAALTDVSAPRARTELARLFPICGRNEVGARSFAKAVLSQVASQPSLTEVDALVDQLWTRPAHQPTRFAVPYASTEDLLARLRELADGKGKSSQRILPAGRQVVFVLSGMGPQWWGMARELIERPGTFSRVAHQIDEQFTAISGWSILAELRQDEAHSKVHTTQIAQTGNFLVQVALAAELAELGIHPAAIVGHSVGEVSAAYLSGMLSLREALTVSYHRARLQAVQAGTGSMLAVGLAEQHVLTRLRQTRGIEIAAVNSPAGVTLAGDTHALLDLAEELTQEGIFNRMLKVEVPYHSHLMDPILAELRTVLRDLQPKSPTLALYSTVTGAKVTGNGHDGWGADYWLQNVRQSVRFADAIGALISDGFSAFLEVGPHPVLSGNVREILAARGETGRSVATLYRNQPDSESLRTLLAELYTVGALDDQLPPGGLLGAVRHQDLPRHLFQRITLWSEESSARRDRLGDAGTKVLPGHRTEARQPEWECDVSVGMLPWLPDHVVADAVLLPGAAYLDAALAAAVNVTGREQPILEDIEFIAPLMVGQHEAPILRCSVDEATGRFQMQSRNADETEWTLRAKGRIVNATCNPAIAEQIAVLKGELTTQVQGRDLYDQLARAGLRYGPSFQQIQQARVGEHAVLATLNGRIAGDRHQAHPAVVDCALQCMATLAAGSHADGPVVPAAV
ncbi:type I polyketide synthase, partial [Aeromonas cavernicola]